MRHIFYLCLIFSGLSLGAQDRPDKLNLSPVSKLHKKVLVGFAFNNSWTTISGLENLEEFTKPSLGFHAKVDYWLNDRLGLSTGLGYQQRGCGIINIDLVKSVGDADSTHRQRYRTNNIGLPIQVFIRQKGYIFPDAKLSMAAGVVPTYLYGGTDIFHSVEDGFHIIKDNTASYRQFDIPFRFGIGIDINANETCLFRVHLNYDVGAFKIYKNTAKDFSGRNRLFGLELSCLF